MRRLLSVFVAFLATSYLWAHDFEVDGIFYNILDKNSVEVSYKGDLMPDYNVYFGEVTIPETVTHNGTTYSVTSIGQSAFQYCRSLTSITIPKSIINIGDGGFYNCISLISITMKATTPPTISTISSPFCDKHTLIYIPDNTLSAYQQAWGNEYTYINNENTLALHIEVPGTLEDLIFSAGTRPALVAKLTLTGTLNNKDFTCMRETMTSLVYIDLSGITNTSGVDFKNKTNLVQVILPANLTSIGYMAFSNCSSLASITIPNSVTSIWNYAFEYCPFLTSITIPNSVTSIENSAFSHCYGLTSITIPNSVTSIGHSAFFNCSGLTSVTIPNSVTSIGESAFSSCDALTSITIPESVTWIGSSAFSSCSSLTSITCLGTTPPNASDLRANTSTCTLIVPQSAYNDYLRHAYWGQFVIINTGYLVSLQANNAQWGKVTGDGLYFLDSIATITATPYDGYTFMRWSDGNTDNPRTIQVTSDTTLTAEFDVDTRRLVTFVDWDGTVLSSVKVTPGEAATAPADPTREGYTFIGWDKDFSAVTDHMTVTAQYQINRYRVRFFDDDTLLKTDSVAYQSAATAPANPYHEGYTFTGWDQAFDSITSDLDVYAMYEMGEDRDMTIVFTNTEDNNSEVLSQSITIKIPAAPEIEGFIFLGWQPVATLIKDVITIQAIYEADVPSSAPEVFVNPSNPAQKLLRNGQVYILQDGQTYTIQGQKL